MLFYAIFNFLNTMHFIISLLACNIQGGVICSKLIDIDVNSTQMKLLDECYTDHEISTFSTNILSSLK